jgi:hypothetical protein
MSVIVTAFPVPEHRAGVIADHGYRNAPPMGYPVIMTRVPAGTPDQAVAGVRPRGAGRVPHDG